MTHWTPEQRADAIGRALATSSKTAAAQTGIPRRTISSWLARERHAPEIEALIVDSREHVAAKLWEAVTVGTEQVLAGLRDPKARLGDKARALEVVASQYALLTGGVTARTESANLTVDLLADYSDADRQQLADVIDTLTQADAANTVLEALPDPTAGLDKAAVLSLVNAIERRLGHG